MWSWKHELKVLLQEEVSLELPSFVIREAATHGKRRCSRVQAPRSYPSFRILKKFLRQRRNIKAEEAAGLKTLPQHAKLAPDLNAIENVWDLIQDRLLLTASVEMDSRTDFIKRLRRTVRGMNANARVQMRGLCRNQEILVQKGMSECNVVLHIVACVLTFRPRPSLSSECK